MKKEKIGTALYLIASACFYMVATLNYVGQKEVINGIFWMCIGTVWLCLGSVIARKVKDREENA